MRCILSNCGVEHGQTGSGKVHRRKLYVIAVQDLLHHVIVQLGSVLAASRLMGSDATASPAGEIGNV